MSAGVQRNYGLAARLLAVAEVTRLHNVAVTLVTTLAGFALTYSLAGLGGLVEALLSPLYWASAAVVALVAAGGYAINDYYDAPIDAVDKPWRPIPSGRLSPATVRLLSYTLMAAGVALAVAALGPLPAAYAAAVALLLNEYSRWIKRTGLPGNLVVAFNSASTIVYGGLAVAVALSRPELLAPVAVPALYAFLLVLAREVVKGIEDYEGDRLGGVRTLAVPMGVGPAARVAAALLAAVIAVSPIPYLAGWYGACYAALAAAVDATAAYSIAVLLRSPGRQAAARARRALKVGFALGGLAFTLGRACQGLSEVGSAHGPAASP